ncbi:MAG TPA: hypothetical protein VHC40_01855 [Rhizomicrobium sp.]|nr:hypothetical protein [Rhizomicrobium sp.]
MPRLLVTPLSGLEEALAIYRPSHLVSLLSPEQMIEMPPGFIRGGHLRLRVNDITDPSAGPAPPAREHIDELLTFSRGWDGSAPLMIHCLAGISRSMAAAYAILCDRFGPGSEIQIAKAMRQRAPHALPNRLLVQHADEALERQGRMVLALNSMGPARLMAEGVPTVFPLVGL